MTKFLIYGLIDPRDGQLRYVGKSTNGLERPRHHSYPSVLLVEKTYKANWLRQLLAEGLKPDIEVLEVHETAESLSEAEQHFIAYFRFVGCRLTNLTIGGDGCVGRIPTIEHREKISKANRGRKYGPETLKKMSDAARRQFSSPEARRRAAATHGGRPFADQFGNIYENQVEAGERLGVWPQNILHVLKGRLKQTGGFRFRYV